MLDNEQISRSSQTQKLKMKREEENKQNMWDKNQAEHELTKELDSVDLRSFW